MDIEHILQELRNERDRLTRAIEALEGSVTPRVAGTARGKRRKGGLTPAGRRRLSEMMKKRWAARRKGAGRKAA